MRMICYFLMVMIAGALMPSSSLSEDADDYFPLVKGTRWVYQKINDERVEVITDVVKKANGTQITVHETKDGKEQVFQRVLVSPKGLYRLQRQQGEIEPPLCILPFPLADKASWSGQFKYLGLEVSYSSNLSKVEKIKVPAGVYAARKVVTEYTILGSTHKTTHWYAPGVGLVKQIDGEEEWLLKEFQLGKN